jgi:hypothetical protein
MNHNVGIWIDHKRAVIVSGRRSRDQRDLESDVEAHPRYSGQQDGRAENARNGTASILTSTTMRSSVDWDNPMAC